MPTTVIANAVRDLDLEVTFRFAIPHVVRDDVVCGIARGTRGDVVKRSRSRACAREVGAVSEAVRIHNDPDERLVGVVLISKVGG
jgi:hypothetical protein